MFKSAIIITLMLYTISGCATQIAEIQDDSHSIRQEFSINGAKAKQPKTQYVGETMVQVCLRRYQDKELGHLWFCKSAVISAENHVVNTRDNKLLEHAVIQDLVDNSNKVVESQVSRELFFVEHKPGSEVLSFRLDMQLKQDVVTHDNEASIVTTIGMCKGKVNFSAQSAEVMLSDDCYYTYKKH